MDTTAKTKMVNSRVNGRSVEKAARILKEHGLTVSAFIRNSLEYVAHMGTVPESGLAVEGERATHDELRGLLQELETRPMPGKRDFEGFGEDDLVERLRMERYGYQ